MLLHFHALYHSHRLVWALVRLNVLQRHAGPMTVLTTYYPYQYNGPYWHMGHMSMLTLIPG